MTKLLERAFAAASRLPEETQDTLAQRFIDEIAAQEKWESLFGDSRSHRLLEQLAQEALGEVGRGETVDLEAILTKNDDFQNH